MAATPSAMVPLGTAAPPFTLPDTTRPGQDVSLADLAGAPATLVAFLCNHCPYVKHVQGSLAALARDARARGVAVVGISSNDVESYPEDGPAEMAKEAAAAGYTFPYLYDESQDIARAYGAECTPDFFLFDGAMNLAYRGQIDGSRPNGREPSDGHDLRAAIDAVLEGRAVATDQRPSVGCSIKWKRSQS